MISRPRTNATLYSEGELQRRPLDILLEGDEVKPGVSDRDQNERTLKTQLPQRVRSRVDLSQLQLVGRIILELIDYRNFASVWVCDLIGCANLQDGRLGKRLAENLQANRQTSFAEPARHR